MHFTNRMQRYAIPRVIQSNECGISESIRKIDGIMYISTINKQSLSGPCIFILVQEKENDCYEADAITFSCGSRLLHWLHQSRCRRHLSVARHCVPVRFVPSEQQGNCLRASQSSAYRRMKAGTSADLEV